MCHVIVGFHVLCVDLGFHVVIGVGRLTVQQEGFVRQLHFTTHTQFQVQSYFLLDVVVRLCPVIVNSICIPNSCIFLIAKTSPRGVVFTLGAVVDVKKTTQSLLDSQESPWRSSMSMEARVSQVVRVLKVEAGIVGCAIYLVSFSPQGHQPSTVDLDYRSTDPKKSSHRMKAAYLRGSVEMGSIQGWTGNHSWICSCIFGLRLMLEQPPSRYSAVPACSTSTRLGQA